MGNVAFLLVFLFFAMIFGIIVYHVGYAMTEAKIDSLYAPALEDYETKHQEQRIRYERFSSVTECPRCGALDLHSIKDSLPQSCRRQCNSCEKVWRQI